jgi:hypothetical protein
MPTTSVNHKPHVHRVQIVVVAPEHLHGLDLPGPHGSLTDPVLKAAEAHIRSVSPAIMSDPHAIIVIGSQVASAVNGKLVPHDHAIHDSVIRMWTESDVVAWEADRPFVILSVKKAAQSSHNSPGAPDNPFYVGPPYASDGHHTARSSIAKSQANGQQYKIDIQIAGRTVDPDILCGAPP